MTVLHEPVRLPIDSCQPVDWNPNVEDLATFNELVEQIEKEGFIEAITVVPTDADGTYQIVAGEHRWKAAKLAGLEEILAVVKPDWSTDEAKIQTVRMNSLRGKFDPEAFTALYEDLKDRYSREELLKRMGMRHREKEVDRMIRTVKKQMTPEMRKELDQRKDKIRTVEDLATVVQSLYAQHGGTLQHGYAFFQFGGRTHLMVLMTSETKKQLEVLLPLMGDADTLMKEVIAELHARISE